MTTLSEQSRQEAQKPPRISNLTQRVITALVVMPLVIVLTYAGEWWFVLLAVILAVIGALEFYVLARGREIQGSALTGIPMLLSILLGFQLQQPSIWLAGLLLGLLLTFILQTLRHPNDLPRSLLQCLTTLVGVIYIGFPSGFMIGIRALPDGFAWVGLVFALSWGTDTFAYLGGRLFGRTKLAPALSPGKTVEGAVIGSVGGIISALIWLSYFGKLSSFVLPLVVIGPLVAILGDLLESGLKRLFQAKDSHVEGLDIFPGHGGVLDRVDSMLLVAVVCYFYLIATGLAGS
jgi:phosphatidate cytidylyltransferase